MHGDDTTWIQTYTGRQFWPLDPRPDDVDILDIAHALAMKCRYTGHCRTFYSVAQHSVLVSYQTNSLEGLLHDAAEAYTADIASPVKRYMVAFKEIEERLEAVIAERFQLTFPWPPNVKEADAALLATERRDLMATPPRPWRTGVPLQATIFPLTWQESKELFLERFKALDYSNY